MCVARHTHVPQTLRGSLKTLKKAPVREWCIPRTVAGLPCERGALFAKEPVFQAFRAFQKRSSRARVVFFLLGGVLERFSGIFETELPCESGALRGFSREFAGLPCESGTLFVREGFGKVFGHFRNGAPVREWCTSREFAGFRGAPVREWCTFCQGSFSSLF